MAEPPRFFADYTMLSRYGGYPAKYQRADSAKPRRCQAQQMLATPGFEGRMFVRLGDKEYY
jgi:hypothetical protein